MGAIMETWVITGGAGFIGSSFIKFAQTKLKLNHISPKIFIYDNFSAFTFEEYQRFNDIFLTKIVDNTDAELKPNEVGILVGDIINYEEMKSKILSADRILHLAANTGVQLSIQDSFKDCNSNIIGTLNCLQLARGLKTKKLIHASSAAPLGTSTDFPYNENSRPKPVSPYGVSKLAGENYVRVYNELYGMGTVSLRFSNVYGEGCYHKNSVVSKMAKDALKSGIIHVNGDGNQTRDMISTGLLNEMIGKVLLHDKGQIPPLFQLGTGIETSIMSVAQKIQNIIWNICGKEVTIQHGPDLVGDVRRSCSDISRFKNEMFVPDMAKYETELEQTVNYIRELWDVGLLDG